MIQTTINHHLFSLRRVPIPLQIHCPNMWWLISLIYSYASPCLEMWMQTELMLIIGDRWSPVRQLKSRTCCFCHPRLRQPSKSNMMVGNPSVSMLAEGWYYHSSHAQWRIPGLAHRSKFPSLACWHLNIALYLTLGIPRYLVRFHQPIWMISSEVGNVNHVIDDFRDFQKHLLLYGNFCVC